MIHVLLGVGVIQLVLLHVSIDKLLRATKIGIGVVDHGIGAGISLVHLLHQRLSSITDYVKGVNWNRLIFAMPVMLCTRLSRSVLDLDVLLSFCSIFDLRCIVVRLS